MTEPPWVDDYGGTFADGLVWCNCGWLAAVDPNDSDPHSAAAHLWGEHAEAEHVPADWTLGDPG